MRTPDRLIVNTAIRVKAAFAFVVIVFIIIAFRLWYLQVISGELFRERSENNRLRTIFVPPPRGLILDRDGTVLVKNRLSFNVDLISEDSPDPQATLKRLAEILQVDQSELERRVNSEKRRRFEPKLLLKDVSRDLVGRIMARRNELPGVIISVVPARDYVFGNFASHLIGYIREISRDQLNLPLYSGYRMGDIVGKEGIEARWERLLQGLHGVRQVVVDASGTRLGEASYQPETAGKNITLSLDYSVQASAEEALYGQRGAIVAMDPNSGEILAMASVPAFDPNFFTGELSSTSWSEMVTGDDKRMLNRAVEGMYPPGSIFKVFMAAAGLTEGTIGEKERVSCPGFYPFGGRDFHCHKRSGHGSVDLYLALVESCDVFFYTNGQRLGIERISKYAHRFGLGEQTGIELGSDSENEKTGLIPSEEWKRSAFSDPSDQRWWPGETLSVAIGQGATLTSPLQLARAISATVNGGKVLKPLLVRAIAQADDTQRDQDFPTVVQKSIDIDPHILDEVRRGMVGVVNDPNGTGKRASLTKEFGITVGGKTGTAQVASLRFKERAGFNHHAWFVGYAPAEDPKIVVVAFVENGGGGGAVAAPLVKQVMTTFFENRGYKRIDQKEQPLAEVTHAD